MAEVIAHPETGRPAVAETSYREIELDLEKGKLAELEGQLAPLKEQVAALESAVSEQKSLVEGAEAIQPPSTDTSGDGGSNPSETSDEAENPAESSDLEGGNAAEDTVNVPVTTDEY